MGSAISKALKANLGIIVFLSLFVLALSHVGAGTATELRLEGYKTVKKGWGNDLESYLEELWSYITHGHGRREKRAIWVVVPVDFESSGPDSQVPSGTSANNNASTSGGELTCGGESASDRSSADQSTSDLPPPDQTNPDDYLKMEDDVVLPPDPGPEPQSAPAPEPSTFGGLFAGLLALTLITKRRKTHLSSS